MNGRGRIGFQSALLVSWAVIIGAFVGAILAWWIGIHGAGVLLMAVAATGLVSRLWGLAALREMEVSAEAERETVSVGRQVTVRYTLKNNKALPLIWVELLQDVPVRGCLTPDDSFRLREFSEQEAQQTGRSRAYIRRFSFVSGYSTLAWETVWTGAHRGIYRPQNIVLCSGDGFGLTQSSGEVSGLDGRMIVVWPRIIPVETWPFLRHVWTGTTGRAGWSEDPTVMLGERLYQPGDPWKRIDWRAAARTDELAVRQFDKITPLSVLFILDAAAMSDAEEGISVTASLIHALHTVGVGCGLALPATENSPPLLLRPEEPGAAEAGCLYALAAFEAESATARFQERAILSAASEIGQIWIVSEGARSMSIPALAGRLSGRGVRLLTARREDCGVQAAEVHTFDEIRRKEAVR